MAFDYGSQDLGLKNPFKLEGLAGFFRGIAQAGIGIFLLLLAKSKVPENPVYGWILLVFALFIIVLGLKSLSYGIYSMLRFFTGRNHPTSLSRNYSSAAADIANAEAKYVVYTPQLLDSMLNARKNPTFLEPSGFLARLLYSIFPALLFMPFPIRNKIHELTETWVRTIFLLISFLLTSFICKGGFAGETGNLIYPISSFFLAIGLISVWYKKDFQIERKHETNVGNLGFKSILSAIFFGVIAPLAAFIVLKAFQIISNTEKINPLIKDIQASTGDFSILVKDLLLFKPEIYISISLFFCLITTAAVVIRLISKFHSVNPVTEVSELRENWQNTVHPRDIFINLDNKIMANRRYREMPNRVYRQLNPQLDEQVNGKGTFSGELIQETQPRFIEPEEDPKTSFLWQIILLAAGNILIVVTTILLCFAALKTLNIAMFIEDFIKILKTAKNLEGTAPIIEGILYNLGYIIKTGLLAIILLGTGRWILSVNHLVVSELRFESLLVYFSCKGTFTESKLSTGMSIHDSIRSENVQVRCSINPWMLITRLVSVTYAGVGGRNLEHPRYVLEMHRDDSALEQIRQDLEDFFQSRETIVGINNMNDLKNVAMISQLNKTSNKRAAKGITSKKSKQKAIEEAGGARRRSED
ncbi:MAG: hypothetical protein KA785_01225 [Spirochaetaceae bacterium]|nr:hypothetical protein [Spirochaetaceae bacterium]